MRKATIFGCGCPTVRQRERLRGNRSGEDARREDGDLYGPIEPADWTAAYASALTFACEDFDSNFASWISQLA